MEVKRKILKNGIRAVVIELKDSPVISTNVFVGAGGRYEKQESFGISHFLEHLAFKGTKKYPTTEIYVETIEAIGGRQNAWTGEDHTAFINMVPNEHYKTAFVSLAEQVTHLLLNKEEIEKERGVILEEISRSYDNPSQFIWNKFGSVVWPGQPISNDVLGPKENILKLKQNEFREYLEKYYLTENMAICVAGGVEADKVFEELEKAFAGVRRGEKPEPLPIDSAQNERRVAVFEKNIDQAHIALAYKAFSFRDPRKYALDLLVTLLGGGMSSVLFKEIREKRGLCYTIYAHADYYSDAGLAYVYAGLNKEKTLEAIKVIKQELFKSKSFKYSDSEINRAKEFLKGSYAVNLDGAEKISSYFGARELLDPEKPEPEEIIRLIDKVTPEEMREVAKEVFVDERENLVIVGPFKNKEKFDKILAEINK